MRPIKLFAYPIVVCVILLFTLQNAFAWNQIGHMLVAQIAYENLAPNTKQKLDQITERFGNLYPEFRAVTKMATWPDMLHKQQIEIYSHWHYIDKSFSADGTPVRELADTDNIVRSINLLQPAIKYRNANPYEQARDVAFLIHFVGDLHQPLHASDRISAVHPFGDEGGNLFLIRNKPTDRHNPHMNLHKLWDSGCGMFFSKPSEETVTLLAHQISAEYPAAYFGKQKLAIDDWANESFEIAKTEVYNTTENKIPSDTYIANCEKISKQRIALAGYRLAELLNNLLG